MKKKTDNMCLLMFVTGVTIGYVLAVVTSCDGD